MKKTLLFLATIVLSMAAQAQVKDCPEGNAQLQHSEAITRNSFATMAVPARVTKAPRRVSLPTNQRIGGYYITDDIAENGTGLQYPGENAAAVIFDREVLEKFVGSKIVGIRVGLCAPQAHRAFVTPVKNQIFGNDTISVEFDSKKGWNTVEVPDSQQIVITDDMDSLLVGFTYTQLAFDGGKTDNPYPLSLVAAGDRYPNLLLYCDISGTYNGHGLAWYNFSNSYGSLSVQLILENDKFPTRDICLSPVTTNTKYYAQGSSVRWSTDVFNFGSDSVYYALNVKVDGKQMATYTSKDTIAPSATVTVGDTLVLPSDISVDTHNLTIEVASLNGEAPTENLADDTVSTSFSVFKESVPRQKQLIEHFTSQSCTYCPLGDELLTEIANLRDDVVRVSVHGNMNGKDVFNSYNCDIIQSVFGIGGWPMAVFNRTIIPDMTKSNQIAYSIGYPEAYIKPYAPFFSQFIDGTAEAPSFVSLTIDPSWDNATRELTVTVKGQGVEDAKTYLDDPALTVYITEDSCVARQLNQGKWISNFVHNNVFRDALTSVQGERIEWDGDNFTRTLTYTVPDSLNASNLNVIAFVAPFIDFYHINYTRMAVNNCEKVSLHDMVVAAGVADVEANHGNQLVRARYNAAGQRIYGERRGLNIIQYTNGKTVKVLVK